MGRLTLNVLLSFAQFEREVTSERIRDKIAASKRKGLWVGGMAPLGYDTKDRKITVNEAEAETRADHLPQLSQARQPQSADGGSAPARHRHQGPHSEDGENRRRHPFHPRSACPSAPQPVLHWRGRRSRARCCRASSRPSSIATCSRRFRPSSTSRSTITKPQGLKSEALLTGRIFDDRGHRMTPSHARKRGVKYRYYISSLLCCRARQNRPAPSAASRPMRSRRWLQDQCEITSADRGE